MRVSEQARSSPRETQTERAVKRRRRLEWDDYITLGLALTLTFLFCGVTVANWPGYLLRKYPLVHEHIAALPIAMH